MGIFGINELPEFRQFLNSINSGSDTFGDANKLTGSSV
jgi:hypothetical protein